MRFAALPNCLLAFGTLILLTLGSSRADAAPTRLSPGSSAQVTAPALMRPMDERRFDFEEPAEGVVEVAWDESPGAVLYWLQVSESEDFSALANEKQQLVVGDPPTRAEIVGLPAGGYYLRVAAVDDQGRRGTWSPLRRFSVNEGPPPAAGEGPALEITSAVAAGDMVIIHGTASSGVRIEASVNGMPGGELTVGDEGDFSMMVEANVLGQNAVTLLAVDKSGRTTTRETSFHYGG